METLETSMGAETRRQPPSPDISARSDRYGLRGKRILYVDDDRLVRSAIHRMLHHAGARCLLASSHDEAATLVGGEAGLTLAILDYHMPDGPAGRLVKRLRLARPDLPLIGTSGAACARDFASIGVPCFLEKPWSLAELGQAVGLACASATQLTSSTPAGSWKPAGAWSDSSPFS